MKNRRLVLVAFLLCACMIVGVGYAALTDDLYVAGNLDMTLSAAEDAFDADIYFADASCTNITEAEGVKVTVENDTNGDSDDKVTIDITGGIAVAGDTVVVTLVVNNDGGSDASLTAEALTTHAYFSSEAVNTTIPANGSQTVTLTLTLLQTITADVDQTITIEFTATSV